MTFVALQSKFNVPRSMHFYYMKLQHAVKAQSKSSEWHLLPTPLFSLIRDAESSKGFISQSYAMLLESYLSRPPLRVMDRWERDVGHLEGE